MGINDKDKQQYSIIHIHPNIIEKARVDIKKSYGKMFYLNTMSNFIKFYPSLSYGYCITIYKSQGSEWDYVFINLNSIKWSIVGKETDCDIEKKIRLFKVTYTALSRAAEKLCLFWF